MDCQREGACVVLLAVLAMGFAACGADSPSSPVDPPMPDPRCEGFYGDPNASTGVGSDTCFAKIEGDVTWTPRAWDANALEELRSRDLENPPAIPTEDPYLTPLELLPPPHGVCAVLSTGARTYRLETFDDTVEAELAGGIVTRGYACGYCSSLHDLAAYAETPDQTGPVRQCTIDNLGGTVEELAGCIEQAVGFTAPCVRRCRL